MVHPGTYVFLPHLVVAAVYEALQFTSVFIEQSASAESRTKSPSKQNPADIVPRTKSFRAESLG